MLVIGTAYGHIVLYAKQGRTVVPNAAETSQMDVRVRYFHFERQIPEEQVVQNVKPCLHCAARLYFEGRQAAAGREDRSRSPRR